MAGAAKDGVGEGAVVKKTVAKTILACATTLVLSMFAWMAYESWPKSGWLMLFLCFCAAVLWASATLDDGESFY